MTTVNYSHIPILYEDHFDIWKCRMLIHLETIDEMLVECVINGPFVPMKANTNPTTNVATPEVKKPKGEWSDEDKRLAGLDSKARHIISGILPVSTLQKVM